MKMNLSSAWNAWREFWFASGNPMSAALFRILLSLPMASLATSRHFDLTKYFTDQGMVPKSISLSLLPEFYRPLWNLFFWPDSWAVPLHGLYVLGLWLLVFGIGSRTTTLLLWLLQISFLQRNYSVAFGADLIGGILLLYLSGINSCQRLSLLKFKKANWDIASSVFFRMAQIQICIMYAYTGFEKLKGLTWWDGTALWFVLANPQMVIADMTWIRSFPLLISVMVFLTIIFEIYWAVLVWSKKFRNYILGFGILLHLGIGLIMGLWGFAFVMLSTYFLFLEEKELQSWIHSIKARIKL